MALVGYYPLSILCIFLAALMAPGDAEQLTVTEDTQLTLQRDGDCLWRVTAATGPAGGSPMQGLTFFIDRTKWQMVAGDYADREAHVFAITDVLPDKPEMKTATEMKIDFFGTKYTLQIKRRPDSVIFHFQPLPDASDRAHQITVKWK